mgnify:FL=1
MEASYTGVTVFYDPLILSRTSHLAEDSRLSKGYREAKACVEALLKDLRFGEARCGKRSAFLSATVVNMGLTWNM